MKKLFENISLNFETSTLEDCGKIAFQNRFDKKFILKIPEALDFLKSIEKNYSVLQVENQSVQDYNSLYFDTPDLLCFNMHKNGWANRFKFRTRKYLSNGKIYNEIKKKLNTKKTLKFRQIREDFVQYFDAEFESLAQKNGFECRNLFPLLKIDFSRITLLNKNNLERITLDFGIKYEFDGKKILLGDTAIAEIKSEKSGGRSFSQEYFRCKHINPSRFSKYCTGICLTNDNAKKNLFLPQIRNLSFEKEIL